MHTVSPTTLHSLAAVAVMLAGGVFIAAFKFALREAWGAQNCAGDPDLPRAAVYGVRAISTNRWHRGASRQMLIHHVQLVQAGIVAFGITSVFIMFLCLAGMIFFMLLGSMS